VLVEIDSAERAVEWSGSVVAHINADTQRPLFDEPFGD
jgi:hypothetical protein